MCTREGIEIATRRLVKVVRAAHKGRRDSMQMRRLNEVGSLKIITEFLQICQINSQF